MAKNKNAAHLRKSLRARGLRGSVADTIAVAVLTGRERDQPPKV